MIYDTFSKRQKRLRGDTEDVFQYELIPSKLRVQVVHILNRTLGTADQFAKFNLVRGAYCGVVSILREEMGEFNLVPPGSRRSSILEHSELTTFLVDYADTDWFLNAVEIAFKAVDTIARRTNYLGRLEAGLMADDAIADLNVRFKENAVGYQLIDGEIVRVDSELLHAEAVKPALRLLNTKEYAGPHQEFLNAYEHYREGRNKEALNDCLKAFESTMKAICDKRGWAYKPGDTAKALIDVLYAEGLVPSFWQNQFASLRGLLESSIPTGRNKQSGHGQGATPTTVPDHMAAYMLHMTASTLVFLTKAEESLP